MTMHLLNNIERIRTKVPYQPYRPLLVYKQDGNEKIIGFGLVKLNYLEPPSDKFNYIIEIKFSDMARATADCQKLERELPNCELTKINEEDYIGFGRPNFINWNYVDGLRNNTPCIIITCHNASDLKKTIDTLSAFDLLPQTFNTDFSNISMQTDSSNVTQREEIHEDESLINTTLSKKLDQLLLILKEQSKLIETQGQELQAIRRELNAKNVTISQPDQGLQQNDAKIAQLSTQLMQQDEKITKLHEEIKQRDKKIVQQNVQLKQSEPEVLERTGVKNLFTRF